MEKKQIPVIIVVIAVLAFLLRWYLMPSHLFFGPEQGRDFLVIRDIVQNHKLTLIGSKTDIAGIFHGPVYYYLAAIPFAATHGNPVAVMAFLIAIQSLCVFLAYQLAFEITKRRVSGYIAALLFAASYQNIVYARWLSNPALSIPFSFAFVICILRFVRGGKGTYLLGAAFFFGLLGQAEFINFLLFAVIGGLVSLVYYKKLLQTRPVILGLACAIGLVTSFSTYILFDMRHQFLVSRAVLNLLMGKSGYHTTLMVSTASAFRTFWEQAAAVAGFSDWRIGLFMTVCMALILYIIARKDRSYVVLGVWFFAPPIIFALLGHAMLDQLYAGVIGGFVILLTICVDWLMQKKTAAGLILLIILIGANLLAIGRNLPENRHVFFQAPQPGVRYTDQIAVIDWIYQHAEGRMFSFQAYTIPYFWQDAWTYLLASYGGQKYGYVPDDKGRKLMYVVIQKDTLDPTYQEKWHSGIVTTWGAKKDEVIIGIYRVEELEIHP